MRKKILVTGGAGFIGSHVVKRLLKEKWNVLVIDDYNDFYNPEEKEQHLLPVLSDPYLTIKIGDITNSKFVTAIVSAFRPHYVLHLAARAGVRPSLAEPELYTRTNIIGTINIFESIKKLPIKNFVFGSSSSVYGNNPKVPFNEMDSIEEQISPYAITKRSAELVCKMYSMHNAIPTTCLRFFTVYGSWQRPDLAIRRFMTAIHKGEKLEMYGNGKTSRDYTYIDDIVDGILKSINTPFEFEIINLGNSHPIQLKTLITKIEKTVGKKALITKKPSQPGDVERTFADIGKAKKLLKWSPKTKIDKGLQEMYLWLKSNLGEV